MPHYNWHDKTAIAKILVEDYNVSPNDIKKRNWKKQLVDKMELAKINTEIELLSHGKHNTSNKKISDLRAILLKLIHNAPKRKIHTKGELK